MEIDTFRTHGFLVMGFLCLEINMNRENIIRMARECGFWLDGANQAMPMWVIKQEELERFAALVASAERESCAEIADEYVGQDLEHNFSALIAHNIRAREQI